MSKYDAEFLITVKRKFADPSRGIKTFADKSQKTDIEADSEQEALDKAFDYAVMECQQITGVTPNIDKPTRVCYVSYANGSSVEYSDFTVTKKEDQ